MKYFFVVLVLLMTGTAQAQLLNKLKNLAKDKVENKVVKESSKVMDSALDGKHGKKQSKSPSATIATDKDGPATTTVTPQAGDLKVYSNYDFIPGDKVIVMEDFSQDARGDFPAKWNTNAGGEIVGLEGHPGQWLAISKSGVYMPEFIPELPDNFTLEFELGCNPGFRNRSSPLSFAIAALKTPQEYTRYMEDNGGRTGFNTWVLPMSTSGETGRTGYQASVNGAVTTQLEQATTQFHAKTKNFVKVSIWRQKQRIRIYYNEEKVIDIAKALTSTGYNALVFSLSTAQTEPDRYFISNLRLATGIPDTRNKLLNEGKFTTTGILFDVNSDRIKPESYSVLKEIAGVLKDNASLKVKITGHTDSDGETAHNLNLSKQRALSVKNALSTEFGIDAERMETDGKGESAPIDKGTTPEAKANNRRVEFQKI